VPNDDVEALEGGRRPGAGRIALPPQVTSPRTCPLFLLCLLKEGLLELEGVAVEVDGGGVVLVSGVNFNPHWHFTASGNEFRQGSGCQWQHGLHGRRLRP
jgi:hypothetical protein